MNDKLSKPIIGSYVLESLTTGMYADPRDALREYVQNSLDSLRQAIKSGVINQNEAKLKIEISSTLSRLVFTDNGMGIDPNHAGRVLLSIGSSKKEFGVDVGFRGIGRLAGIAYCDKLTFETTSRGSDKSCRITFDCKKLSKTFDPKKNKEAILLEDILRDSCTLEFLDETPESHFFRVILSPLNKNGMAFTEGHNVDSYLAEVSPVDYFQQKFIYASQVRKMIKESPFEVPTIQIEMKKDEKASFSISKPYKSHLRRSDAVDIQISDVTKFTDPSGSDRYWGWYGESDLLGAIANEDNAGFRVRLGNILIGGPTLTRRIFEEASPSNGRFNNYYIGEIFIAPGLVTPNARRDDFEDSEEWSSIKASLLNFFKDRSQAARDSSDDRHKSATRIKIDTAKIIEETQDLIDQGIPSAEKKEKQLARLQKTAKKISKALKKNRSENEKKVIVEEQKKVSDLIKTLENVKKFAVSNLTGVLDRKQIKILKIVYEVLENKLSASDYKSVKGEIEKRIRQP